MPIGTTASSPRKRRPGETISPSFGAWKLIVRSARTAAPPTWPVDESIPDGHVERCHRAARGDDRVDQRRRSRPRHPR